MLPNAVHRNSAHYCKLKNCGGSDVAINGQMILPAHICVEELVKAEGNSALAAERLGVSAATLVASIAQDPTAASALNSQLRTLTTLMAFDTLRSAKALMDGMLVDMDPGDFARFFGSMIQTVNSLTTEANPTQDINVQEAILNKLPPAERRALLTLMQPVSPPSAATVDGESEVC